GEGPVWGDYQETLADASTSPHLGLGGGCGVNRDRPMEGGGRRPRMRRWPANTVVPGVERAPNPVRVSCVRKVDSNGGGIPSGRTGCPRSECRRRKRSRKPRAVAPGTPPGWLADNWP